MALNLSVKILKIWSFTKGVNSKLSNSKPKEVVHLYAINGQKETNRVENIRNSIVFLVEINVINKNIEKIYRKQNFSKRDAIN